jgi:predicted nucleic acid-binding protein
MIGLDSHALIWGVQGVSRPGQEGMIERTRRFLRHVRDTNAQVIIPSPALLEYLVGFDQLGQQAQLRVLEERFMIPSFDTESAAIAANILARRDVIQGIRREHGVDRQSIRTDVMIVAIASQYRVDYLVSHDPHMIPLGAIVNLIVREVPDIPRQEELFDGS